MNLNPFLLFDGNCAEAMTFYQSCLGGELAITKLADTPMKEQAPPELHEKVAFAHLESGSSRSRPPTGSTRRGSSTRATPSACT